MNVEKRHIVCVKNPEPICVEFECSPWACMGFLWVSSHNPKRVWLFTRSMHAQSTYPVWTQVNNNMYDRLALPLDAAQLCAVFCTKWNHISNSHRRIDNWVCGGLVTPTLQPNALRLCPWKTVHWTAAKTAPLTLCVDGWALPSSNCVHCTHAAHISMLLKRQSSVLRKKVFTTFLISSVIAHLSHWMVSDLQTKNPVGGQNFLSGILNWADKLCSAIVGRVLSSCN